jgi:hypothetical protein
MIRCTVAPSEGWERIPNSVLRAPDDIQKILAKFTHFYQGRMGGRRLDWNLHLTTAKIGVTNASFRSVHCSGEFATVLLGFSGHKRMKLSAIAEACHCKVEGVQEVLNLLCSRKCHRIMGHKEKDYWINKDVESENEKLRLFMPYFQVSVGNESQVKSLLVSPVEKYIDALIMKIMKEEKSLDKEKLRKMARDEGMFEFSDELFAGRLGKLHDQEYVKVEASGRVHYVP